LIEDWLDELFASLIASPGGPALAAQMSLTPDRAAASHFIAAPRPQLTAADMQRLDAEGLIAELARVLADLPAPLLEATLSRLHAIADAMAANQGDGDPEPPSLTYALH
jgi:hypothetical protein